MASRLDELIREHADRLDRLAGPIDLTDVTRGRRGDKVNVTLVDSEPTPTQPGGTRRWPIVVAAAALVAVAVGGLLLVIADDDPVGEVPADRPATVASTTMSQRAEESLRLSDRRVREAAALRVGFVALPPGPARPTTPERGVLVLTIRPCTASPLFDGLSVFTDGRLIWAVSGRMVQQRLTPEGVEMMRSELLGSGLLDMHNDDECEGSYYVHVEVDGDPYGLEFTAPLDDVRMARLADPWAWLPDSAWAEREIKAFVPAEYSVLITNMNAGQLASRLPAAAYILSSSRQWQSQGNGQSVTVYAGFRTEEVRTLVAALDAAGFTAEINDHGSIDYHDDTSTEVTLRPRLPWEVGSGPIPG
jgi:hypothetical protein